MKKILKTISFIAVFAAINLSVVLANPTGLGGGIGG
jgi:hypothetical protein